VTDYYELLGVPRTASSAEVRQAYLKLARERHPDRFSDPVEKERAQEFFKELTAAFNTLSNERGRQDYDASLEKPKAPVPAEIARDAYERALAAFEQRAYHEAVELMRTAVQHAPNEALYHSGLAAALAKNPHWVREAIQEAEASIQLEPRRAVFHSQLAELLLGQGLKIRALKAAEAALRLNPADDRARRVAAEAGGPDSDPTEGGLLGRLRRRT
jgi:curved DNA-binding protein CbpA